MQWMDRLFVVKGLGRRVLLIVGVVCLVLSVIGLSAGRYFNDRTFEEAIIDKSRSIHSRIEAAAKYVALQGGLTSAVERLVAKHKSSDSNRSAYEVTEAERAELLLQVPVFAAMAIGKENSEKEHYSFRVFSDKPRRSENLATPEELKIFQEFEQDTTLKELVTDDGKVITVFRPVRLSEAQGCLLCHGNAAQSPWGNGKDVLGYPMENWMDGKLHGVFAVSTNIEDVLAAYAQKDPFSATTTLTLVIGVGALGVFLLAIFLLRKPVSHVKQVSQRLVSDSMEVGAAVGQIFSISQELSAASESQAEALHETAASIEEISAMVKRSADNAAESERASEASKETAQKGREVVQQMALSMDDINQTNESVVQAISSSNERISEIVKVIEEIGTKTQVINDIVFQTKLLSFNASVEAARAGAHGKGFAVVAEEIGNLAHMSGSAAKEISHLLDESVRKVEAIVTETKSTVEDLASSARSKVERGTQVARQCEEVLAEIVSRSSDVSQMVSGIAYASDEQAKGVAEISSAIRQIDRTNRVSAESSDKCATAASELSTKVRQLRSASSDLKFLLEGERSVARFIWGDEYVLGVAAMDEEHKILIQKMNMLAEVLERGQTKKSLAEIRHCFNELANYAKKHFTDEEAYMQRIGYPGFVDHKKIHDKLLADVGGFARNIDRGDLDSDELMSFLNDWLMRHILASDKKYANHARTKGIGPGYTMTPGRRAA